MQLRSIYVVFILTMPMLLNACATFAPDKRTPNGVLPTHMPEQYMSAPQEFSSIATASQPWWKDFKSKDLDKLVSKGLNANFDILTAWANLRQSKAISNIADAGLFPSINLDTGASQKRVSTQTYEATPFSDYRDNDLASQNDVVTENFNIGLAASYELDLWGKINSERQAEILRLEATAEDLQSVAITVAASIANTWVQLLGNRAELKVLQEQISINKELVKLQTVRFNNGLSTSLTVLQQKELLASLEAQTPALEKEASILRNELAVLQGTLPGTGLKFDENVGLPSVEAMPELGLPIQLLDARPDIKAAWARLGAGDWDISQAHANRYPSLKIQASYIFDAPETGLLLTNWVAALAGSLFMPIFDGGALSAKEEQAKAKADALVQAYAKTVAQALQEVDDALASDTKNIETLKRLKEQHVFAKAALTEARNSYLGGVVDFLNYITELENVQKLERNIAQQKTLVVQARIVLYRTLGGLTFPNMQEYVLEPQVAK